MLPHALKTNVRKYYGTSETESLGIAIMAWRLITSLCLGQFASLTSWAQLFALIVDFGFYFFTFSEQSFKDFCHVFIASTFPSLDRSFVFRLVF